MKKNNIIRKLLIILLIIGALIVSLDLNRPYSNIERKIKEQIIKINKSITTKKIVLNQNESYTIQKNINIVLEKEINELKKLLNLNSTLSEYNIINATILSRNSEYWLNQITLDKGMKDGVEKGMAVITSQGLIGEISKITSNSSEVKLLTTNKMSSKISVIIQTAEKDFYAILNGYNENKQLLELKAIDKNIKIKKGDKIITSGLGNMPKGLFIGTVEEYEIDEYELSKIIYVKTAQDLNDINYVTIIKEKI